MKHIASLVTALSFCISLFGQTKDTIFVTIQQESAALEKQRFAYEYDEVFGTMIPARWAYKWYLLGESDNGDLSSAASIEHKFSPAFSMQLGLGLGFVHRYDTFPPALPIPLPDEFPAIPQDFRLFVYQLHLQPRWYYNMGQGVREGRSANNFSGNYLGLQLAYTGYGSNLGGEEARLASDQLAMALRWGWQRRLFRDGFAEFSFGLGARYSDGFDQATLSQRSGWDLFANTQFSLGLATFSPTTGKKAPAYCEVLRCFREESGMMKIDLFNLLRIADRENLKGQVSLGWEQKLGQSAFSIELLGYVRGRQEVATEYTSKYEFSGWGFGGHVQPRFYLNLKKRIATGKSGNNLSGPYLALQSAFGRDFEKYTEIAGNEIRYFDGTVNYWNIGPLCGVQYRFFKSGFIDLNMGFAAGPERTNSVRDSNDPPVEETSARFVSSLRIGLAF